MVHYFYVKSHYGDNKVELYPLSVDFIDRVTARVLFFSSRDCIHISRTTVKASVRSYQLLNGQSQTLERSKNIPLGKSLKQPSKLL